MKTFLCIYCTCAHCPCRSNLCCQFEISTCCVFVCEMFLILFHLLGIPFFQSVCNKNTKFYSSCRVLDWIGGTLVEKKAFTTEVPSSMLNVSILLRSKVIFILLQQEEWKKHAEYGFTDLLAENFYICVHWWNSKPF